MAAVGSDSAATDRPFWTSRECLSERRAGSAIIIMAVVLYDLYTLILVRAFNVPTLKVLLALRAPRPRCRRLMNCQTPNGLVKHWRRMQRIGHGKEAFVPLKVAGCIPAVGLHCASPSFCRFLFL